MKQGTPTLADLVMRVQMRGDRLTDEKARQRSNGAEAEAPQPHNFQIAALIE